MEKTWVKIFSSPHLHKAEFVKSLLSQKGISSVMKSQDSLITSLGETDIFVSRDDVLRAKLIMGKTELDE